MHIVMMVNTDCMRAKITCEGRIKMILEVNKRHKSEGETKGSLRKNKGAASATGQHRMHEEGEITGENKRHRSEEGTARVTGEKRCR